MATVEVERVLEEWAAGWSAHDVDKVAALFTDDCVYEDVPLGAINHGKEELKAFGRPFFQAFPDFTIELTACFAADAWAAMEWLMSGTHEGDLPGMPATGKSFSVRGSTILELRDGRIRRNSDYWDMATFLKQVGLTPSNP